MTTKSLIEAVEALPRRELPADMWVRRGDVIALIRLHEAKGRPLNALGFPIPQTIDDLTSRQHEALEVDEKAIWDIGRDFAAEWLGAASDDLQAAASSLVNKLRPYLRTPQPAPQVDAEKGGL